MSKIESLVTGNLTKDAELKRSQSGKEYALLVLRVDGNGEKPSFVRASVFGDDAANVAGLKKGDAASLVGKLDVGIWQASDGPSVSLSLLAHRAISPSMKKPKVLRVPKDGQPTAVQYRIAAEAQAIRKPGELSDDLPW